MLAFWAGRPKSRLQALHADLHRSQPRQKRAIYCKILVEQGPQVLGWEKARKNETKLSLPPIWSATEKARLANEIEVPSVEITARLINALIAEIALISVHQAPSFSIEVQEDSIRQFILGLRKG